MPAPLEKQVFYTLKVAGISLDVTGRKRTPRGYIQLCIKKHPNADVQGYVMEHRVIIEQHIGRFLDPHEIVHHINEIRHDNRISNLEIMERGEHIIHHHLGSRRPVEARVRMSKAMTKRYKVKENHPSYKKISKELLKSVLKNNGPKKAAEILGVTRKTIYNKINEFDLEGWYKNVKQGGSGR